MPTERKPPFPGLNGMPLDHLLGKNFRIRAIKATGSARFLDGLTATVVGVHPIAPDWVSIKLHTNPRTHYRDWTIPADRLVPLDTPLH